MSELKIGIGVDDLVFGMSKEDVKKKLGEPDEVEKMEHVDPELGLTESWHYDLKEISVSFEEVEDWKLSMISVSGEVMLDGTDLAGIKKADLIKLAGKLKWGVSEEDTMPEGTMIDFNDKGLSFWIENEETLVIHTTPLLNEESDVIWPLVN